MTLKKHVKKLSRKAYLARAVREFYPDLQGQKHDDPLLMKSIKLGKHRYDQALKCGNEITVSAVKPSGGRMVIAPTVREKHCTIGS